MEMETNIQGTGVQGSQSYISTSCNAVLPEPSGLGALLKNVYGFSRNYAEEHRTPGNALSARNIQLRSNDWSLETIISPGTEQSPSDIVMGEINEGELTREEMEIETNIQSTDVQKSQPYNSTSYIGELPAPSGLGASSKDINGYSRNCAEEHRTPGNALSALNIQLRSNDWSLETITSPGTEQSPSGIVMGEINEGELTREETEMEMDTNIQSTGVQERKPYISTSCIGELSASIGFGASFINVNGYSRNYAEEYKMESNPRGFLLIINNKEFSSDLGVRTGTDVDCKRLKKLFLSLGFYVAVRQNLKATEMILILRLLSQFDQLNHVDSLAVAILTHGKEDYLYGVDGDYIHVNDVYRFFTAENCQALHHKPKFFIINACRGDAEDTGSLASGSCNSNINLGLTETAPTCRRPNIKDFLLAYSTIQGHVSWRHTNNGSLFIQGLVNVFTRYARNVDVLNMLVKVNHEVSSNTQVVQIPAPQFMLTKRWYLNPIVRS